MAAPIRITGPLLDILEAFLRAWQEKEDLYGWAIMKAVKRSGPTVYGVLDRLEDAGWITGTWEPDPEPGRPPRRLYQLTPTGHVETEKLLAERRPATRASTLRPKLGLSTFSILRALPGGNR
jgi:DNA-binding PadR family transcriptional regulator